MKRLDEIKENLAGFKHWKKASGISDYAESLGPDMEYLLTLLDKYAAVAEAARHAVSAHYENHLAEVMMLVLKGTIDDLAALDASLGGEHNESK